MALATTHVLVIMAGNLSTELRKASGYLAAGSAAIVTSVMANYASAQQFADGRSLRFTMFWLLMVIVLAAFAWFPSLFILARISALDAMKALPDYGQSWKEGERAQFQNVAVRSLLPPMRAYVRWQMSRADGDVDLAGVQTGRWAAIQGLTTLAQFVCVAIAAIVLLSGLRF